MRYEFLRLEHVNLSCETILEDIQLTIYQGELLGIVGQNQSGKTALAKLLCGLCQPDSGTVYLDGEAVRMRDTDALVKHHIMYMNYHSRLIESMDLYENIGLPVFMQKYGLIRTQKKLRRRIRDICAKWDVGLDLESPVAALNKADTHLVLLARALVSGARMVILDCITSGYTESQYRRLSDLIRRMTDAGIAVVYVQQGIDSILHEARRTAVLKAGRIVRVLFQDEFSDTAVIRLLAGNAAPKEPEPVIETGEELYRLEEVEIAPFARKLTVTLHRGEAVGLAVQEEHARLAIAEALFGLRPLQGGSLSVKQEKKKFAGAADALRNGIVLIPEAPYHTALFPTMKLYESVNFFIPLLMGRRYGKKQKEVQDYISENCFRDMDGVDGGMLPAALSHLQAFLLALRKCRILKPQIYVIVHPTLGIDMWTHSVIYREIHSLLEEGACVLLISPDADELGSLCNKILFLDRTGRNKGSLCLEELRQEQSRQQIVRNLLEK